MEVHTSQINFMTDVRVSNTFFNSSRTQLTRVKIKFCCIVFVSVFVRNSKMNEHNGYIYMYIVIHTDGQVARRDIGQENSKITEQMSSIIGPNCGWNIEMRFQFISVIIIIFNESILCNSVYIHLK